MLSKLTIQNLALVDNITLTFDKGLSVLTGETGAGKSVIVNALALVLGGRSDKENIRFGFDKAIITAEFDLSRLPSVIKKSFKEYLDEENLCINREFSRNGKGLVKINNKTVKLNELKTIAAPLAEILSQHANQKLMNEDNHLEFLDNFASLNKNVSEVAESYSEWKSKYDELAAIKKKRDSLRDEIELLNFQSDEIEKANIHIGEEDALTKEKKILDSARALIGSSNLINDIFTGDENSINSLLQSLQKELDKMTEVDNDLKKQTSELTDLTYRLNDLSDFMNQYGSSINDDPARIEEINLRLDEIYNLKQKYGGSEENILKELTKIKKKLNESPIDIDQHIIKLEEKCSDSFKRYSQLAIKLSGTRAKTATFLKSQIEKELSDLAIDNAEFEMELIYEDDSNGVELNNRKVKASPHGLETARILFTANPGEPLKPLVKTASGGEISRVLLAMKTAEQKNHKLKRGLLVFDEVDAGIGGKTALEVGRKLKSLSNGNQVLVITHLHQIARQAAHHYLAEKKSQKNRSSIAVRKLDSSNIEAELKRMVSLPE